MPAPNLVFIDLDLDKNLPYQEAKRKLEKLKSNSIKTIKEKLDGGQPTILWTGNGYHIYLPINAIILDQESIFSRDRFPNLFSFLGKYSNWSVSEVFLNYAEIFFTNGKADPLHKPKYKTCLIRIPGTYNSKLLNKGFGTVESLVKIIQKWDGSRIPIQYLLKDFRRWLIQKECDQKLANRKKNNSRRITTLSNNCTWIENLLQIPLKDQRKYCIFHILIPYLVNVKRLPPEEVSRIIIEWLSRCNKVQPLDFDPSAEIKNRIKYVKDFKPMTLAKLQTENRDLYRILINRND